MSDPGRGADAAADLDVLKAASLWLRRDGSVAIATVIDTWGSAPVPVGGQLVIAKDGQFQGSVSGGCVEGDVIAEAEDILQSGKPKTMAFGVADETAWQAGLPCGGEIKVYIERLDRAKGDDTLVDRALAAREGRKGLVLETDLETGDRTVFERHQPGLPASIAERFQSGKSSLETSPAGDIFVQALLPPARVVIVGATHIGQVLSQLVQMAGYELIVIDPRTAFASPERFGGVNLMTEWPQDAVPRIGLDPYTAVVALAHVSHIDDEVLKLALKQDCLYIGALGSKRNHAKRTERLKEMGFTDADVGKIHAPIGIDIGAQTPAEIAVSIMAEIVRALRGTKR